MERPLAASARIPLRPVAIVVAVAVCLAVGWGAWTNWTPRPQPGPVQHQAVAPQALTPPPASAAGLAPSFDIVRVSPDGGIVMAGQAEPGSKVTVKRGDAVIAETEADQRGAWVAVPATRLEPGSGELTLSARNGAGQVRTAETTVVILVPAATDRPQSSAPPLALLSTPAAPSRLLQEPPGGARSGKLGLGTVDYDDNGAIRFSGTAPPGATVRVYIDNAAVGDSVADVQGQWALSPDTRLASGLHRLRLDQLNARGRVANRVELPFEREVLAAAQVGPGQVVVQPGQNLWRLARRAYGMGLRYTVIYAANRDQIRDAKRIYPGQVFAVPTLAQ